jgi:uncharacterized membrane protein SpoIIM required for sporulation
MDMPEEPRQRWQRLSWLLDQVDRRGWRALSTGDIKNLCRLYRHVTIDLSRARTGGEDPDLVRYLNGLAARAHGHVYRTRPIHGGALLTFITRGFPQLVRRRWQPIAAATAIFVLTSLASCLAVLHDPESAYSLFDEHMVEYENLRLEKQEGEYHGNFTFDVAESPLVAVLIFANNIRVSINCFAMGALCCLPGALFLVYNGRMLGTLTGLMLNHGYFMDFYSLILTHGVLELSAICIAGGAGLLLGWALIAPGRLSRRDALRQVAGDAFGLLAGSCLLLIVAGLIEAYVTPHFPQPVRWSVALLSAVLLLAYLGQLGRNSQPSPDEMASLLPSRPP